MLKHLTRVLTLLTLLLSFAGVHAALIVGGQQADILFGRDDDNVNNPEIQPITPPPNQSLNNTDVIDGLRGNDVLIGLLGNDVIRAGRGNDVTIGGTENFISPNKDVIFGNRGNDINIWAPGDGSDAFLGGHGHRDAQVFGVIDTEVIGVVDATDPDPENVGKEIKKPIIDEETKLPTANVTGSPGFCRLERVQDPNLGYDFLVRFFVRATGNLAVTIRLADVEQVFCTSEEGGEIIYANLRAHDPEFVVVSLDEVKRLNRKVAQIIR